MFIIRTILPLLFLLAGSFHSIGFAQAINHWETVVNAEDNWQYQIGNSEIPLNWFQTEFDATEWSTGPGGFGYGDEDDNTVLEDITSVYLRKEFSIENTQSIVKVQLHADFDDGFVAYLNGTEIARQNLGTPGQPVAYDTSSDDYVEALLFQGQVPAAINIDPAALQVGENILSVQVHNFGENSSDLSALFYLSLGINDDSSFYGPTPDWFISTTFESSLPLLILNTAPGELITDEPRVDAHLSVINNGAGATNSPTDDVSGYNGAIAIELHGTSSQMFDKKGYAFETRNEDGSNNNVELLGLPSENDWILHGPYSDKSLLRNVLSYHLGELTGRYAPRTRLCEVILNDQYEGIYVLTEKIKQDENRVDIAKLTPEDNEGDELTGGYIIKIDRNGQEIPGLGWYSDFPDNKFYAYVDPKDDQITAAQEAYIQNYIYEFESAMDATDYYERYQDYIDVNSLVDYFLVTEITKHIDAFKLSFYLYKDKDSNGGKLHFGPLWDFNLGYGNFDFGCSPDPAGWAYEFPDCGTWHPFWARKLLDIPEVQHLIECRWEELRTDAFSNYEIISFIDAKVVEMGAAVDRNFSRWPVLGEDIWPNDFVGNTYAAEKNFFKNWTTDRLNWMDANMVGECSLWSARDETSLHLNALRVSPNPAQDRLHIRWSNDEPAIVELYNLESKLVKSTTLDPTSSAALNTADLSNGMYQLMVSAVADGRLLSVAKVAIVK